MTGIESNKVRALLAYLVAEADRPQSRDALIGLLWPNVPDAVARHNLRQALANLRQAIGDRTSQPPMLQITRETVQLNPVGDYELDVAAFEALLAACAAHAHRRLETCTSCARRLKQAVEHYRGSFLEGFFLHDSVAFDEWVLLKREWLQRLALDALAHLAAYHERRGDYAAAYRYAVRQMELEPWREEAHRQAMRALFLSGQRGAALAQYERCRTALDTELGVEPEAETIALYERLRVAEEAPGRVDAFAIPAERPHNLLPQPTPFIGREVELEELADLLGNPACRLLTIVGPGGIGKTRLALQATADQLDTFTHGVFFVALAPLSSAEFLIPAIADALALSFHGSTDPKTQLLDYVCEKELLLVLDNIEHLLAGVGLLAEILQHASAVTLLVTSRERLNLRGEWVYELGGLQVPASHQSERFEAYGAVNLFLQSAHRVHSGFALGEADKSDVLRICQLVEGMPLGIELAASWVRAISCAEIAQEIERNLEFLTTSLRDMPERHRSLRAVFGHSWRLLSDEERSVLRQLSVFRGGFQRDAAEHVAGASVPLLSALIDQSLLRRNAVGRYDMHELIRQYADEKLQEGEEAERTRNLHAVYYLALAEAAEPHFRGAEQMAWLHRLEAEHDNLRAAMAWSQTMTDGAETGLRLAGKLGEFWKVRGYLSEGRRWLADALTRSDNTSSSARAKAFVWAARLAWDQGDFSQAAELGERSLALYQNLGDKRGIASAYNLLGIAARALRDFVRAMMFLEESLSLFQDVGDKEGMASALSDLGGVVWRQSDYTKATRLFEQSLALYQDLGDKVGSAGVLRTLALVAQSQGDYSQITTLFEQSLALYKNLGHKSGTAGVILDLGELAWARCDYERAKTLCEQSLALCREIGSKRKIADAMLDLGDVAWAQDDNDTARTWYEESATLLQEVGDKIRIAMALDRLGRLALTQHDEAIARIRYQESIGIFEEIGFKPGLAAALLGLATVACRQRDYATARSCYTDSLAIRRDLGNKQDIADTLGGMAELAVAQEQNERAARLLGSAEVLRDAIALPLHPPARAERDRIAATARAQLGDANFTAAWAAGRALTLDEAIAEALDAASRTSN